MGDTPPRDDFKHTMSHTVAVAKNFLINKALSDLTGVPAAAVKTPEQREHESAQLASALSGWRSSINPNGFIDRSIPDTIKPVTRAINFGLSRLGMGLDEGTIPPIAEAALADTKRALLAKKQLVRMSTVQSDHAQRERSGMTDPSEREDGGALSVRDLLRRQKTMYEQLAEIERAREAGPTAVQEGTTATDSIRDLLASQSGKDSSLDIMNMLQDLFYAAKNEDKRGIVDVLRALPDAIRAAAPGLDTQMITTLFERWTTVKNATDLESAYKERCHIIDQLLNDALRFAQSRTFANARALRAPAPQALEETEARNRASYSTPQGPQWWPGRAPPSAIPFQRMHPNTPGTPSSHTSSFATAFGPPEL